MMTTKKTHLFFQIAALGILFLGFQVFIYAQEPQNYWRNPDVMIQDQATLLFEQAHCVLDKYPPSALASDERKLALFSLDALLHDPRLDNGMAFIDYVNNRYLDVASALRNKKPKEGETKIYKLYNHGFVIQSPSVTIAMDIIRGGRADNPFVGDSVIRSIVDECDILFISHQHGDHADISVAQLFNDQKKPIIAPTGMWEGMRFQLVYLSGEDLVKEKVPISCRNISLSVSAYPGHQDNIPNHLYLVTTPEGVSVMHTGDQYNVEDMEWIAQIGNNAHVDILLMHSWMPEIEKSVEGIKPKVIVVGHENEMGHTIDHRESFGLTFRNFQSIQTPFVVMAWGECFDYF